MLTIYNTDKHPQNMKKILTFCFIISTLSLAFANPPSKMSRTLKWKSSPIIHHFNETSSFEIYNFEGASYRETHPSLPYFTERFLLNSPGQISVQLLNAEFEPITKEASPDDTYLSDQLQFETTIEKDRQQYFGRISFIPIIKTGTNSFERVTKFSIRIDFAATSPPAPNRGGETTTSVLSDGEIYKMAVNETGVHKLTYDFLKNDLGISNIDNIDPRTIKLYGNGGGVLSENLANERIDDLMENAIKIVGEEDGSFDGNDYLLFYGEASTVWRYVEDWNEFGQITNFYDNKNYYFLKISSGNGKRIATQSSVSGATYTVNAFDNFGRVEDENRNLLHEWSQGQGSGRAFFGDFYKLQTEYDYTNELNISNMIPNTAVKVRSNFGGRMLTSSSGRYQIIANGNTFSSPNFSSTGGDATDNYASQKKISDSFTTTQSNLEIAVKFVNAGNSENEGWLDYLQVNYRQNLEMDGDQMSFRDLNSLNHLVSDFQLSNATSNIEVWDISNPLNPFLQTTNLSGNQLTFEANTNESLKQFIAFNTNGNFLSAEKTGETTSLIENQNIHGIDNVDFVIIYHKDFQEQAERLANHRASHSEINVEIVDIEQLQNEFSSGRVDATGIRDFAKMLYDRNERFKSLLLFGDGSFDPRNIYELNGNFVPVYETVSSTSPITAYPSDDYFGILDEGETLTNSTLDIGVGRLPVNSLEEAKTMVDKIICYDTAPSALGDWRNRILFVADDEDNNTHLTDADDIANTIEVKNPNLNIEKVYVDAFPQESTPGGTRVPLATEALNRSVFKGTLAVTFLGHGGAKGWTQERILKLNDITSFENFTKLPLFITATCSFSGYDAAGFVTGGEALLLNPNGGAIAMFSTTRAVYASENEKLTRASVDTLFFKLNNQIPTIGEVLRISKNKSFISESNSRKFALLGDPSMQLALPKYTVTTKTINGQDVSIAMDTIRALQKVTVTGQIEDDFGNLMTAFNGVVQPTIYDKRVIYQTLGQDPGSPVKDYTLRNNIIFKGRASVTNGQFTFTFVVPKDIDYNFGEGKISYYAFDEITKEDAAGSYYSFVIGGTDPNAIADGIGPNVEVFMNTEDFVYGGITDPNPTLLVILEDDNGINVSGNSIGHDLSGVLDMNTQNTFILNDFYEAELDDHTKGKVRFPLKDLEVGEHEIKVTAWDVANNDAEGLTKFVVVEDEKLALERVLNYPNPFTSNTCFMFQHNMGAQDLDVLVNIYTVSGRLVKTIEQRIFSEGYELSRNDCVEWDGRDDFGDPLAKGVYIYKVKVRATGITQNIGGDNKNEATTTSDSMLTGESDFERLVILK